MFFTPANFYFWYVCVCRNRVLSKVSEFVCIRRPLCGASERHAVRA